MLIFTRDGNVLSFIIIITA